MDIIFAAQASDPANEVDSVVVATGNPPHLSRLVSARNWRDIEP